MVPNAVELCSCTIFNHGLARDLGTYAYGASLAFESFLTYVLFSKAFMIIKQRCIATTAANKIVTEHCINERKYLRHILTEWEITTRMLLLLLIVKACTFGTRLKCVDWWALWGMVGLDFRS